MKWYTYKQVAEILQVSVQTVRYWMRTGQLTVNRISSHTVRISQESLDNFLSTREAEAKSPINPKEPACVRK